LVHQVDTSSSSKKLPIPEVSMEVAYPCFPHVEHRKFNHSHYNLTENSLMFSCLLASVVAGSR
jgi:hypothetical protein